MLLKKWKNTSGATILIALFFLLLCSLAGAVVLTASSTSSGRLSNLKKNEQSYYTLSSTAKLLKKEIEGEKYSRYQIYLTKENQPVDDGYNEIPQNELKGILIKAADYIFEAGLNDEDVYYMDTLTIQVSDPNIKDVQAEFMMDAQYNITIEMSLEKSTCIYKVSAVLSEQQKETIYIDEVLTGNRPGVKRTTTLMWTGGEIILD